jgi:predicted alpha-1,2-mannosidase
MRRAPHLAAVAALALAAVAPAACTTPAPPTVDPAWRADSVARFVDPFIGTHGDGNVFPGATVPWGMASASPHTRQPSPGDYITTGHIAGAGYIDDDPEIHGLGLTHLSGAGCPDLGAPVVAAVTGALPTVDFERYGATRTNERAWPGYWAADLVEPAIRVEATATARGGAFRFFARKDDPTILVDASRSLSWYDGDGGVRVVSRRELEGWSQTGGFCVQPNHQKVYFVARFDHDAAAAGTWKDDVPSDAQQADGVVGGWFRFPVSSGRTVELAVGVSYVSIDGARANLEAELAGKRFDEVRVAAQDAWEAALGRVRVDGGSAADRSVFYTALYHALLQPSLASDVDGSHQRFGGGGMTVDVDADHPRYHVFGLWDTYRTVHPLLALVYPETQRAMARSLVDMTIEAGAPPMWELAGWEVQMMVGDPADIVLADAAQKGLLDLDRARLAWPILQAAALDVSDKPHRPGNASYRALGYVPIDEQASVWGPVSTTLEYALADDALGRLGAALGVTVDPALAAGASSWKNLIDPTTQLFRPRHADGSWLDPFDPDAVEGSHMQPMSGGPGFVEGTAWNYAFFVPHAVAAHAAATGGDDAYVARLQSLFDSDRFAMWNEPDIAFPYLFTHFAGQGWRTAAAVNAARARYYTTAHDGIPGNDDTGAMSAWYVWSALGLYPDVPDGDDYAIGTPLFDRATLTLPGGKPFVIDAAHATPASIYVSAADLDGRPVAQRIAYRDVVAGGTLHLTLGDAPP